MAIDPLPNNVIAALPQLSWRGLTNVPCDSAPFDGSHDLGERKYPYRDAASHDPTGRNPYVTTVRLLFGNMLGKGTGGKLLYPDTWRDYKLALEDSSIGKLVHPDLGEFDARVVSWKGTLDARNRGGITIDVVWTESSADITEPPQFTDVDVSLSAAAAAADAALASVGISYPTGESFTSLSGLANAVTGSIFSAGLSASGLVNQALGTVAGLVDSVEALGSADAWPALDNLLLVHSSLQGIIDKAAQGSRPTGKRLLVSDTSLDAFARDVNNTLEEVQNLNLSALRSPIVKRGTTLVYFTG